MAVQLRRGTTQKQIFVLKEAGNRPTKLVDPPAATAVVTLTLDPVLPSGANVVRVCEVLETYDVLLARHLKQGQVQVAAASDPAMMPGVYRGSFFVEYPDGTHAFFPSAESVDFEIEA